MLVNAKKAMILASKNQLKKEIAERKEQKRKIKKDIYKSLIHNIYKAKYSKNNVCISVYSTDFIYYKNFEILYDWISNDLMEYYAKKGYFLSVEKQSLYHPFYEIKISMEKEYNE